jgi:hypothetical protein
MAESVATRDGTFLAVASLATFSQLTVPSTKGRIASISALVRRKMISGMAAV